MSTKSAILYVAQDEGGRRVMQFQIGGGKLGVYHPPANLDTADKCLIVSVSRKKLQLATKAKTKEHMHLMIERANPRLLLIDIINKQTGPTHNKVPLGTDDGYKPVDTPKYPE